MKANFETEKCSRCQGSGKHSFCERYADRCFKCGGSGLTYSKRGEAARAYYEKLCTIPASQVKIGDRIDVSVLDSGNGLYNCIGTVTEIKSREYTKTTVKTLREDGIFFVSHSYEYSVLEGFGAYSLGGSSSSRDPNGVAGTFVEKGFEYNIKTSTKYGDNYKTTGDDIRTYPADNSAMVAEALAYQASLTKQGKVKKSTKKGSV